MNGYLVRGRDDLVYNVPENADQPVTNRLNGDGIRDYQGKFTWAAMLTRADGSTVAFQPGDEAVLTIIVFHQREPGTPNSEPGRPPLTPAAIYAAGGELKFGPGGETYFVRDREDKDVLRTGSVMLLSPRNPFGGNPCVRRIALAALNQTGASATGDPIAFVEFEGGDPPAFLLPGGVPGPLEFDAWLLPDAVAVLERDVTIETTTGFAP